MLVTLGKFLVLIILSCLPLASMAVIAGNPAGKVTLIEYFDYRCPHCRRMAPIIDNLIKNNAELCVEYRVLPAFGYMSLFDARAAIASGYQGKYAEFRRSLMTNDASRPAAVMFLADEAGLNIPRLKKTMNSRFVSRQIRSNIRLFEASGFKNIPIFLLKRSKSEIIAYRLIGEQTYHTLQHSISALE